MKILQIDGSKHMSNDMKAWRGFVKTLPHYRARYGQFTREEKIKNVQERLKEYNAYYEVRDNYHVTRLVFETDEDYFLFVMSYM